MLYRQSGSTSITNNNYAITDQVSLSLNAYIDNIYKPEQYLVLNVTDSLAIPIELRNQALKIDIDTVNGVTSEFLYYPINTTAFNTYPEFLVYTRVVGADQAEQTLFSNLAANIETITSSLGTSIKFGVSRIAQADQVGLFASNTTYIAANITPDGDLWLANHLIITSGIRWAGNGVAFTSGGGGGGGSYGDGDVAAFLPTYTGSISNSVDIKNLWSNAAIQHLQITAANLNIDSLRSNISAANTNINSLRANISAANLEIDALKTSISSTNLNVNGLRANITAANIEIDGLRSNINAANAAIVTANLNMKLYVDDTVITANNALKAYTDYQITTANTAVVAYVNALNLAMLANVDAANSAIITANLALKSYIDDKISSSGNYSSEIDQLRANIEAANLQIVYTEQGLISYINTLNSAMSANVIAANLLAAQTVQQANANIKIYVDDRITASNNSMKVYVDAVNTKATSFTISSNSSMKLYVDAANSAQATIITTFNNSLSANINAANANILATNAAMKTYVDDTIAFYNTYGDSDVALFLPTYTGTLDNSITIANLWANATYQAQQSIGTNAAIVTANTNMKAYVDTLRTYVNTSNTNMKLYVDDTVTTANTGLKAYVDDRFTENAFYSNAIVAAYLPEDSTIITLFANAAYQQRQSVGTNAAIVTANTAMKAYVDNANASMKLYVDTANTNMRSYVITANNNMQSFVIDSNTRMKTYVDDLFVENAFYSNAVVSAYLPEDPTIISLFANAAYQQLQSVGTNAAIVTANTNMKAYVDTANAAVVSYVNTQDNLLSVEIADVRERSNVAKYVLTDSISVNDTFYPMFSAINGGNTAVYVGSSLQYNPSTGNLTTVGLVTTSGWGRWYGFADVNYANVSYVSRLKGNVIASSGTDVTTFDSEPPGESYSGALIVIGGTSISKSVKIGGTVYVHNNNQSLSTTTGAITTRGGVGIGKDVYIGGVVHVSNSTTAANTVSGALIVDGGVGIGDKLFVEGNTVITSTSTAGNTVTGALVVAGGAGIGGPVFIGGNLVLTSGTNSGSVTTGALVVQGGVGASGNFNSSGSDNIFTGKLTVGGTTSAAQVTAQSTVFSLFAANTSPGPADKQLMVLNNSSVDNPGEYAALSFQVDPTGLFNYGRILGDLRYVRENDHESNAYFLFSGYRQGGDYKDFAKIGFDNSSFISNLSVSGKIIASEGFFYANGVSAGGGGGGITQEQWALKANINSPTFTGNVVFNSNTAITLPVGTVAERPSGTQGMVRYNSELGEFEGFTNTWGALASGGSSAFPIIDLGYITEPAENFVDFGTIV